MRRLNMLIRVLYFFLKPRLELIVHTQLPKKKKKKVVN